LLLMQQYGGLHCGRFFVLYLLLMQQYGGLHCGRFFVFIFAADAAIWWFALRAIFSVKKGG